MDFAWLLVALVTAAFFLRRRPARRAVGFFHPYYESCGGGERVLWVAVDALCRSGTPVVIYGGTTHSLPYELIEKRFGLELRAHDITVVPLLSRWLLLAECYPRFTMIGQSVGSMIVAIEASLRQSTTVYIDSVGYAFTYPMIRILNSTTHVLTYTHYPTISTDMLEHNAKSWAKKVYYRIFAQAYGFAGGFADLAMVNSTWTFNHINELWKSTPVRIVYPPCDYEAFTQFPLEDRELLVISIGQFRPEKDHVKQVNAFAMLEASLQGSGICPKMVMIGGVRDSGDAKRASELKELIAELSSSIELKTNATFAELKDYMGKAFIGLHTMWNEHFGIGVVELMAAGVIVLAHDSGGPKLDIVSGNQGDLGFRSTEPGEYADAMERILRKPQENWTAMRTRARSHSMRFSDSNFVTSFMENVQQYI